MELVEMKTWARRGDCCQNRRGGSCTWWINTRQSSIFPWRAVIVKGTFKGFALGACETTEGHPHDLVSHSLQICYWFCCLCSMWQPCKTKDVGVQVELMATLITTVPFLQIIFGLTPCGDDMNWKCGMTSNKEPWLNSHHGCCGLIWCAS